MISFGTDSALDKDVKERLMAQVFSVLPVLYDDQQAYIAHHKLESEKRLTGIIYYYILLYSIRYIYILCMYV